MYLLYSLHLTPLQLPPCVELFLCFELFATLSTLFFLFEKCFINKCSSKKMSLT